MWPTMNKSTVILVAFLAGAVLWTAPAEAKKKKNATTEPTTQPVSTKTPAEIEAQYAQSLDKRATAIVDALNIDDPAKATRVHDIIVAQYRDIRDWHEANDTAKKASATQPAILASRQ